MARTITAEQFVQTVRERTNMEESDFVSDEEILEYGNQEIAELRQHLRRNEGQVHVRTTDTIAVVNGTSLYNLPADFWELLSLSASIEGREQVLEPFMEAERSQLSNAPVLYPVAYGPRYRLQGTQIEILPSNRTFTATIRYVSRTARLRLGISPPDSFDGINGYEMAPIYGACASVREKEETDPSFFVGQKMAIYRLIDASAAQRDASHPERVTDVYGGLPNPWDI